MQSSTSTSSSTTTPHKTPTIRRWLVGHPRFHLHFTPTYSSWLNLVERWFAELTEKWIRRGTHRSTAALEQAIKGWLDGWNENPRPFIWVKTADQILEAVAAFCHRTSDSGHQLSGDSVEPLRCGRGWKCRSRSSRQLISTRKSSSAVSRSRRGLRSIISCYHSARRMTDWRTTRTSTGMAPTSTMSVRLGSSRRRQRRLFSIPGGSRATSTTLPASSLVA